MPNRERCLSGFDYISKLKGLKLFLLSLGGPRTTLVPD